MTQERVQRRLAAILAADVVGYSRMMEADEAGTLAALETLRRDIFVPKTKQCGGRIFKTTGDGAPVEFTSAADAVNSTMTGPCGTTCATAMFRPRRPSATTAS